MSTQITRPGRCRVLLASICFGAGVAALSGPVLAQHHGRPAGPGWHGDITRFHEHDWGVWRAGRWVHQRHDGRLGWWWVVGGAWYFYPLPVYPYPNPWEPAPVLAVPPAGTSPVAPPTQYWYLCEASNTYYPYVATCPGGWKQVPAVPANAPTAPSK